MSMNELTAQARAYFELMQQIADLEAEAEAIKDRLKAVMVERETEDLQGPGWRATWHNTVTNRFDSSAFKKAHADLYDSFCRPVTGTRFTLNAVKA
jgi:predicted phage-related endonuclease